MSEMPNLEIWNSNYTHLRKDENQVSLNVRTFIKNKDDEYTNSTVIGSVDVLFSVESFEEFVEELNIRLTKLKAELGEVAEVA